MANPKESIWGAPSSWVYSLRQSGLETTAAQNGNFDKPKTAYFGTGSTSGYEGSLLRAINVSQKLVANEFLDESICPCGQDPNVSPWGKIAIFNKNNNGSAVPEIQDFTDKNINWFFADKALTVPLFTRQVIKTSANFMPYEQYAPKATTPISSSVVPTTLCPYVSWGLKSLLLSIEIGITANDANPVSGSLLWVKLDEWKNNYSTTHYMSGLRFFVRGCTAINSTTLALTYNNEDALPSGIGCSGLICPMNKIKVKNGGEEIPTQFLYFMGYASTTRRAHIFTPTEQIVVDSSTANAPWLGVLPCWEYFENQTIQVYHPYSDTYYYYYKIPYSDDTYNKVMSIAALFGCFFTPTNKYVFDYDMLDNDLYLPIIDENGVAHGQYTRGAANATNPLYTKNSIRDIDYDPDAPPTPIDPNTYSNTTGFNYITEGAAMTVRYVLDGANVDKLLSDLWTINASIAQGGDFEYFDGKIKDEYLTTNPIDCIVSLIRYPFNIPYQLQPLQSYVKLGKTEGSAKGWTTVYISNQINFQGIDIFPRFGDCFLDYEPYTTYELYVPFCGTTKIRAADILGHTLNLTMLIDLITGSCTAYVKADQLVIETLQGSCGVQQQISGTDTATMNANIYNGILAQKQAKTGMIAQAASALLPSNWVNPVGYAAKGEQAETSYKQATFAIEHVDTPVHSQGAASPLLGWIQEFDARLMIYFPEGDVIDGAIPPSFKPAPLAAFGHLKGFATVTPGTVGAFRSSNAAFISGDIIADDIPCTLSERNRIKSMFADGVYLPPL